MKFKYDTKKKDKLKIRKSRLLQNICSKSKYCINLCQADTVYVIRFMHTVVADKKNLKV